jgi:hypothetical protein
MTGVKCYEDSHESRPQNLPGRPIPTGNRPMNSSMVPNKIRGFPREEQRIGNRRGELSLRIAAALGDVAVRASRIGITLPVMGVGVQQLFAALFNGTMEYTR